MRPRDAVRDGIPVANDKVYIHEFIDIIGHHRADYMHHMTANWSPIAQEERHQLCYGVWGIVGSTGPWPSVVNMWEEDGWDGLASSFGHELGHAHLQDPKLARWWATGGGVPLGRVRPHPRARAVVTRPSTELCAQGAGGVAYAHDQVTVPAGRRPTSWSWPARPVAPSTPSTAGGSSGPSRRRCATTTRPSCCGRSRAGTAGAPRRPPCAPDTRGGTRQRAAVRDLRRILLVDAPLSPLRIGRQPARRDRDDSWSEE